MLFFFSNCMILKWNQESTQVGGKSYSFLIITIFLKKKLVFVISFLFFLLNFSTAEITGIKEDCKDTYLPLCDCRLNHLKTNTGFILIKRCSSSFTLGTVHSSSFLPPSSDEHLCYQSAPRFLLHKLVLVSSLSFVLLRHSRWTESLLPAGCASAPIPASLCVSVWVCVWGRETEREREREEKRERERGRERRRERERERERERDIWLCSYLYMLLFSPECGDVDCII